MTFTTHIKNNAFKDSRSIKVVKVTNVKTWVRPSKATDWSQSAGGVGENRQKESETVGLKGVSETCCDVCLKVVSLTKRQEAEFSIVRFSIGVTRMDMIMNEFIGRTAQVKRFEDKFRD